MRKRKKTAEKTVKQKKVSTCSHKRWKFKQTDLGVKRTCKGCGLSITDVAAGKFGKLTYHKTSKGETIV
jgi:hypothetical protein